MSGAFSPSSSERSVTGAVHPVGSVWDPAGSSELDLAVAAQIHPVLFSCSADARRAGGSLGSYSQQASISETLWRVGGAERPGSFLSASRGLQQWQHLLCGPASPHPTEPSPSYPGSPCVWETPPAPCCPTLHLT